jgi:iduronate 2-sulfatase
MNSPCSLLFVALFALASAAPAASAADRPNVLWILIDDLRPSLGCYGDKVAQSPNIDQLARSSRRFERAYCQQAVCGPSRASLLTGRLPDNTRVWHNRNRFRDTHPNLVTLPQLFKNHGYFAQGLGKVFSGDEREEDSLSWSTPSILRAEGWKNYVLPENVGRRKQSPFEKADVPDEAYPDGKLAELAVATLQQLARQPQPFFLAVGFFKPHLPFCAPQRYWDRYDPALFLTRSPATRTTGAPAVAYPDHLELAGYRGVPPDERVSAEQARDLRHGYYACLSYVDAQVGKLLVALARLGLDDKTIVVLCGDHGYSLGEADHWCKDTNFELDTRVPLLIRTPGMAQPGVPTAALVEYVDLYPTLAALAGLAPPSGLDGQSLTPILADPRAPGRDAVLSQFSRPFKPGLPEVMGYSVRTAGMRYTRWIDWKSRQTLAEELYDYQAAGSVEQRPPFAIERTNVAADPAYAAQREHLRGLLAALLAGRTRAAP